MVISPFWATVIEAAIKSVIIIFVLATGFAYMTFAERKVAALFQTRVGPNRAGPFGFLQPAADGIKLIFKEELIPAGADKVIFVLAPIITAVPALIILAVVPWGPTAAIECCSVTLPILNQTLGGHYFTIQNGLGLTDLNVGILYILSVASIAVYGVVLAGWASDNKYAMFGGIRSSAQMVSYELALGLSVVGPLMLAQSMSMNGIIAAQRDSVWYLLLQPVAAVIFYIAALAEVNRAPFDMPEAEQELTAGYHTEYSGMKFSLFFMAEYIKMIAVSAIFATLFLGGWDGPFAEQVPWLGLGYFWLKVAVSLFFMIWLRSTHPRLRYDRLMALGWKVLLPLALANIVVTAAALIDTTLLIVVLAALAVIGVVIGMAYLRRRARQAAARQARAAARQAALPHLG
ncbi:MAG: NADH-quinone oxidoreductase subunit NuoH [Anaerolineales bacterium]|nr:NADH-quinone oxidoreductase subunit NuoH [Anaerolineales bacterium]